MRRRNGQPPPVSTRLDWALYEYLQHASRDGNVSEYLKGLVAADAIENSRVTNPDNGKLMQLLNILKARLKRALCSCPKGFSMRWKLRIIEPLSEMLRRISHGE